ncbi:hypothetical protein HK102_004717 [Quaeritorhiza haematococci]|nr:hypothetical protein HK102_004717 [Quaeritorhiza haematococci]
MEIAGIAPVVQLAKFAYSVYNLSKKVVVNKRRANTLGERVRSVADALENLNNSNLPNHERMQNGLKSLEQCLEDCRSLLQRYTKKNNNLARRIRDVGTDEEEFTFINERLHHCIIELQLRIQVDQLFQAHQDDADFQKDLEELRSNQREILELLGHLPEEMYRRFNELLTQQQKRHSTRSLMASSVPDIIIKERDVVCHADNILGRGGFGVVYRGTFRNENVAIKKLRCDNLSERARKELMEEASRMRRLSHPRIVVLLGVINDSVSRTYSLVMEYMENGSLYARINSLQPALSWKDRLIIARDIASGMAHLHRVGLIHRDLKSQNVLLDSNNRAKICDFGMSLVRTESKSYVQVSQAAGTVCWMAPECFGFKPRISTQSDVYAFGIILWEMTAWDIPYQGIDDDEIRRGVKKGERLEIPENTPNEMNKLLESAWHPQPQQRPSFPDILKSLDEIKESDVAFPSSKLDVAVTVSLSNDGGSRPIQSTGDSAYNTMSLSPAHSRQGSAHSGTQGGSAMDVVQKLKRFGNFFKGQWSNESTTNSLGKSNVGRNGSTSVSSKTIKVESSRESPQPPKPRMEPWSDQGKKLKGKDPAIYAAGTGCLEDLKMMGREAAKERAGEDFGQVDEIGVCIWTGFTALMVAAAKNHVEICEWLLQNGADVHSKTNDRFTPLHQAALHNATDVCELLLKKRTDLHAKDNNGYTPLHRAVVSNATDVCDLLLRKGADPNVKDNSGDTPLHKAAFYHTTDACELLLRKGADPNVKDNNGRTPLELAQSKSYDAVVSILLRHGAPESQN